MPEPDAHLGVTFDTNKLFYAVSAPARSSFIERVGQIDFSFDLVDSIARRDPDTFPRICDILSKLIRDEDVSGVRIVIPPILECWSIVPKTVYDQDDEREAHLDILMRGVDIRQMAPEWHQLSNRDFKLLSVRHKANLETFSFLMNGPVNGNLCSDFQIGEKWMQVSRYHGSFMTVSSYNGILSISSYILGKLRAATYISYEDVADLSYLWLQYSSHLPWMLGMHEQILVFGDQSGRIIENLQPYWDDSSEVIVMDSLEKMQLNSEEETYSFPLERAFPAILLSVS